MLHHRKRLLHSFLALLVVLCAGALFFLFGSSNISAKDTGMSRFEWTATNSAPKAYPIELLRADLLLSDGSGYYVPDRRVIHHGWGKPGATHIVGETEKALPERLNAVWFSYLENKFYTLDTALPTDAILQLMGQGIKSPQRDTAHDYDRMVFGFGPEGEGAVWLSGHSNMIDVFRFKGVETEVAWTELIDNPDVTRDQFIDIVLEDTLGPENAQKAKTNGYRYGTWPRRQQKWAWAIAVAGASQISLLKYGSLNGEVFHFFDDLEPNIDEAQHGAPQEILLHWTTPTDQARTVVLQFDEAESLQAFEELAATGEPMTLRIELSETGDGVAVMLETPARIYEFERTRAEIYSRD